MAGGKCPKWLAVISNRVLPPLFFLALAAVFLYTSTHFDGYLNFELSLAGVFSGDLPTMDKCFGL